MVTLAGTLLFALEGAWSVRTRQACFLLVVSLLALAPSAGAAAQEGLLLTPDWPASFDEARSQPVPLLPGPPVKEGERTQDPLAPGLSAAGTEATFELALLNPDGSTGPVGPLDLDPTRAVVFDLFLGADATYEPTRGPDELHEDHGAAPRMTVQATLRLADETVGPIEATADLVSTPAEDDVTRYRFTYDIEAEILPAGAGMDVTFSVYQADRSGQRVTQPLWNIHTDQAHPTGVQLPLEDAGEGSQLSLQSTPTSPGGPSNATGAYIALVGGTATALGAAVRMVRRA